MKAKKNPRTIKTAEQILLVASKLFAAKGYEGTSTKEICQKADVNIAAIHYHFGSKEGLLLTILEKFGAKSLGAVQRILINPGNKEEFKIRLRMFLEETVDSYLEAPEVWQIVQTEAELMHSRTKKIFQKLFIKRSEALVAFFTQAKKAHILRKDVDPWLAARSLFSQICHQTRMDHVYKVYYKVSLKNTGYRSKWVTHTLEIFTEGICTK